MSSIDAAWSRCDCHAACRLCRSRWPWGHSPLTSARWSPWSHSRAALFPYDLVCLYLMSVDAPPRTRAPGLTSAGLHWRQHPVHRSVYWDPWNSPGVRTLLSAVSCCSLRTNMIYICWGIKGDALENLSRICAKSPCGLEGVAGTLLALRLLELELVIFCSRRALMLSVKISRSVRPV